MGKFETPMTNMTSGGSNYRIIDVPTILGEQLEKFPITSRILMENIARNTSGDDLCMLITALHEWFKKGVVTTEVPFYANRVLMHDTTSTPALVDVAVMRASLPNILSTRESGRIILTYLHPGAATGRV